MTCKHENFEGRFEITRVTEGEGGPVKDYMADIHIKCTQCQLPFKFIGMKSGMDYRAPTVSFDGLEARLPLRPSDEKGLPPPPRLRGFGIKFNGEDYRPDVAR